MNIQKLFSGRKQDILVQRISNQYEKLNTLLFNHEDEAIASILSFNNGGLNQPVKRGLSDALLFHYIAEALSDKNLSKIISKYKSLILFFESICNEFFATPYYKEDRYLWKVSHWHLCHYSLYFKILITFIYCRCQLIRSFLIHTLNMLNVIRSNKCLLVDQIASMY